MLGWDITYENQCALVRGHGFALNSCTWDWKWTLDSTDAVLFHVGICAVYAATVYYFQAVVKGSKDYRAPSWIEPARLIHNILLSLVSLLMMVIQLHYLYSQNRFTSWQSIACVNTPNSGIYGLANLLYLVTKLWEWLDTYFLIFTQKEVIFLHYFHHMTTFTMAAVTHNFPVGGYCFINCAVHFIMYMHYAFPVRWARSLITTTQLTQFVIVLSIHTYGYLNPTTCYDMSPVLREWWFNESVVLGFFVLFVNFYLQQYVFKKAGGGKGSKGKKVKAED
jgi:hypothetical protein